MAARMPHSPCQPRQVDRIVRGSPSASSRQVHLSRRWRKHTIFHFQNLSTARRLAPTATVMLLRRDISNLLRQHFDGAASRRWIASL